MIVRTFSPLAQRVIAVSLLALLAMVAVLFILLPVATGIVHNLRQLDRQRDEQTRAEAILAQPPPRQGQALDAGSWIRAADGPSAARSLAALVTGYATRRSVEVTVTGNGVPTVKPPVLLLMSFTARGEQAAVLAFIGDLESGRPLLRYRQLTLQRQAQAPAVPTGPSSAIASQSPNLTDDMLLQAPAGGSPSDMSASADNAAATQLPVTMLQADGIIMGLWGAH